MELQLKDLESVVAKRDKISKAARTGDKVAIKELVFFDRLKELLLTGENARKLELEEAEVLMMKELQLLTSKPVLYVCNVDEASVVDGNKYVDDVKKMAESEGARVLIIGASIESDIAEFDDLEERSMFLQDLGLQEAGVAKLIRTAYELLDLHTYFTAGEKEVRAWTVLKGAKAPEAAGVIHTDFEKGFIRAEVMAYADFVEYGSENAVKEAGKLAVEGKEYVVKDGDIMHFRFNV